MEVPKEVRETMELMLEACQENGTIEKATLLRKKSTWGRDLLWLAAYAPSNSNISLLSQSVLAGEIWRQPDLVCNVDPDFAFEASVAILRQPRREEENRKVAEMVAAVAMKCGPIVDRIAMFLHDNIRPESDLDVLLLIRCYGSLISNMHRDKDARLQLFRDLVGLVSGWLDTDTAPPAIQTVVLSSMRPWLVGWELLPDDGMFYLLNRAAQIMEARVSQLLSSAGAMNEETVTMLLKCASACENFISDFSKAVTGATKNRPEEYGRLLEFMGKYFAWAYKNLPLLYPVWRRPGFPTTTLRIFGECLPFLIEDRKDEPEFAGQICRIVSLYGEYFDEELFQTDTWGFWIDAYEHGTRDVVENIYVTLLQANPVFAVRALAEYVNECEEAVVFLLRSGMPIIAKSENAEAQALYGEFVCRLLSEDIDKCNQRNLLSTMFLLGAMTMDLLPPEIAGRWGEVALVVIAKVVGAIRESVVTAPDLVTASAAFEYVYEWFGKEKRELDGEFAEAALVFHCANPPTTKALELIASRGSLEFRVQLVQQSILPEMIKYLDEGEGSCSDETRFKAYCGILNDIMRSAGPEIIPQGMPGIFRRVMEEDDTIPEVLALLSTFSLIIKDHGCWMEYLSIVRKGLSCIMAWGNEVGFCMCTILSQWGRVPETREAVLSILLMLLDDAKDEEPDMLDCVPVTTALCLVLIFGRPPPEKINAVREGMALLRNFFLSVRDEGGKMQALACLSLMELDILCFMTKFVAVDVNEIIEMIGYCWENGLFVTNYHRWLFNTFCKVVSNQPPIPLLVGIQEELKQGKMRLNRQFCRNFEDYLGAAISWKPPPPA